MDVQPAAAGTAIDEQNPWPGLSAFDESAQRFFGGREVESVELLRLVGQAPLTVLFGKSGLGKTSLLQAGLFPRLRHQNILPVYLRMNVRDRSLPLIEQAAAALQAEVAKHRIDAPAPQTGESLWEYLHGRDAAWWSPKNQSLTPLFVFDQFEEVFTLGADQPAGIERLRLDLADLIENRIPLDLARRIDGGASVEHHNLRGQRYKLLFSFREDFLPEVEGWKGELPSVMRNRLRLLPMRADRALQVASGKTPAGAVHHLVDEPTAREIVRFVAAVQSVEERGSAIPSLRKQDDPGWDALAIEPALLSLVCEGLNEKRKARGQTAIDAALLKETGAAIIGDFYQRCVTDVPDRTRRFIEDALITEGGFRNSYPLRDALDQDVLTEPLLRQLVDRRLLRIDHQLGVDRVELIHDRLTDVVREHRNKERERIRVRRQRRMRWAAGSVAVVLGGVGLLFFVLWQSAQSALREAVAGKLVLQSRSILEGRRGTATADVALLLAAAAYRLKADSEAYGGLQFALNATPRLIKVVNLPDPVIGVSPDGAIAVTSSAGLLDVVAGEWQPPPDQVHTMRLWDAGTGLPRGTLLRNQRSAVWRVALSPDGKTLVSASEDRTLRFWDASRGELRGNPALSDQLVNALAFSPDGGILVAGGSRLRRWDPATGTPGDYLPPPVAVGGIAISPDGKTLATVKSEDALRLWDTKSYVDRILEGKTTRAITLAFSPDNLTLASGDYFGSVQLWNVATGEPRFEPPLRAGQGWVWCLAFSNDGGTLVSAGMDKIVRLWDVVTGKLRATMPGHGAMVTSLAFRDGQTLVSGSDDRRLMLWDAGTGRLRSGPRDIVSASAESVAFSPDGKTLASGGDDGAIALWDVVTGASRGALPKKHTGDVLALAFSPDGKTLASAGRDKTVRLWDIPTRLARGDSLTSDWSDDGGITFSPDGKTLVSPQGDWTVRMWDMSTRQHRVVGSRKAQANDGSAVLFTSDGRLFMSDDGKLRLSEDPDRAHATIPHVHKGKVQAGAFSPDGSILALGDFAGAVRLWDTQSGQPRGAALAGPGAPVSSLTFSADGKFLVSGHSDGKVRLWNGLNGQPVGDPLEHGKLGKSSVDKVAFSPDGQTLLSVGGNVGSFRVGSVESANTLRLWDAPATWIDRVCAKLSRNLSSAEWKQFAGDTPYEKSCPNLPVPPD